MVKNLLKNVYIRLLERKAKKCVSTSSTLIFVLGGQNKRIIASQIRDILSQTENVVINPLGYNHRIGIALTLLQQKAGTSSFVYWLAMLFKNIQTSTSVVYICELTTVNSKEDQCIINFYQPDFVIKDESVTHDVKALRLITSNATEVFDNAISVGKLLSSTEQPTHNIQYSLGSTLHTFTLNNFGVQYEFPTIIGFYLKNTIHEKRGA